MNNESKVENLAHMVMEDFPINEDHIHVQAEVQQDSLTHADEYDEDTASHPEAQLDDESQNSQRDRNKFQKFESNEGNPCVEENIPDVPEKDSKELFPCKYCEKSFSKVYHLNRHKQNVHSERRRLQISLVATVIYLLFTALACTMYTLHTSSRRADIFRHITSSQNTNQ